MNLLDRTKQTILFPTGSTSGGTANPSTYLDMAGWEGCMFIIATCTQLDTTGSFVVRQSSDASTGGAYTYTTDLGVTFTTGLKQGIVLDIYRPLKRYLQHEVETRVGRAIIAGEAAEGSSIRIDEGPDGQLEVDISAPPDAGPKAPAESAA